MKCQFAATNSPLHRSALELRYQVLRVPLGMPRGSEVYAAEDACLHLVAVAPNAEESDTVVGCVVFHPNGEGLGDHSGRLLQMAVATEAQGQGVGRQLVETLEHHIAAKGITLVTLHAREVAFGFYESLGYEYDGEPYVEVGIPHHNMRKRLTA